ncbi:threonine dehydrogenase-like Zn-dependent dehydrogenase [Bradyrhizobium sp. LM2.7]
MRAVVIHAPKDLRIDSYPDAAPASGEVRVKIANGGICGSDLHYYHHGGFGVVCASSSRWHWGMRSPA